MDEQLQGWCARSLDALRRLRPRGDTSLDPALWAERAIDRAAFLRLMASREIPPELGKLSSVPIHGDDETVIAQLTQSCPLSRQDPVEVLGEIHEFLVAGRDTTRLHGRSQSRKKNGVFYTPQQIVNYILKLTLHSRLERLAPPTSPKLTILDPAAGCGNFLCHALRLLLSRHLRWYQSHEPESWPNDVVRTPQGWRLTWNRSRSILQDHLFGVDLDTGAIQVAQRILWMIVVEESALPDMPKYAPAEWIALDSNLKAGNALIGPPFGQSAPEMNTNDASDKFRWEDEFPSVAQSGGFDVVIGNPPYRRERDFKREMDEIAITPLGRFRSPRMDLWYYFVHRGIELLRDGGSLSFITNAYWLRGTGAEKLLNVLCHDVHLDEVFLLQNQPVFNGVSGRHTIFCLTKTTSDLPTTIKLAPRSSSMNGADFDEYQTSAQTLTKSRDKLFAGHCLNLFPPADALFEKLNRHPRLKELGIVRQGIAENPATINRRTLARFAHSSAEYHWKLDEGVFSLQPAEIQRLQLSDGESQLIRPYHDLCDLDRFWTASQPSRRLVYSTKKTCPSIDNYPALRAHLQRFRAILDARRETAAGSNQWWHLHWPRDERVWMSPKLVALQMAPRPSLAPAFEPIYVTFSANVFVPSPDVREDLRYLCGLLNSRILWAWFEHHGKHRGVGLELNGNVLAQVPIRRIQFDDSHDVTLHDQLVELVNRRMILQRELSESRSRTDCHDNTLIHHEIDNLESAMEQTVAILYGLDAAEVEQADRIVEDACP